ncbi:PAS domain S-box-containing protein [Geothermobacter ehrlichii]|uniref:histidine kinase n=1 Tax=Geothermobacter ehrlichii TaxID=213224 RepID=A0A5D3WHG8_9BACT|nr:PAS domain S-box protein [Geothermobacter ehrlichii]TYO96648.1 PAS domain S-box-containing protein [Geothermobacter ehrlichii]
MRPRLLFFACLALLLPALVWGKTPVSIELTAEERAWLEQHGQSIRVGVLPNYPPIEFLQDGRQSGLTADYLRAIEEELGIRFRRVVARNWAELQQMALAHRIDIIGSIQQTPKRAKKLLFTRPYVHLPNAIITRRGAKTGLREKDLAGLRVAVVQDYASWDYLRTHAPNATLVAVDNDLDGLKQLAFGQVDAFVTDLSVASWHIDRLGLSNLQVGGSTNFYWDFRFGVRNDWPLLHAILDKALAGISDDARQALLHRWVGLVTANKLSAKELTIAGLVLGLFMLLIIAFWLWNRLLQRQVELQTDELRNALQRERRIANELRRSEAQLRELTDNLPQTVFEIDTQGIITYVNRYCTEWSGYSRERLIGRCLLEFLLPEDRPVMERRIRILLGEEPEERTDLVYRIQLADGRIRSVLGYASPILSGDRTTGLRGILVDINERLSMEIFLDDLLNAIPDPIFAKDRQHRWIRLNDAFCELIGKPRRELLGKSDFDLFPEEEARVFWEKDDLVFTTGETNLNIERITPPEGSTRILATRKSLMLSPDGEPILVGVIRDITEQEEAARRLAESERRFRQIFDATSDALFIHDAATGVILDVNKTAETMYRASRDELLASDIGKLSSGTPPFDQKGARMRIANALLKGHTVFEWHTRRFDGELFWVEVSLRPATIDNRRVIIATVRDISRRKELEEMMLQAEKMLTIGHLAAGIAHEINNPLAGVLQNLQVLGMRLDQQHPGNRQAAEQAGLDLEALSRYSEARQIPLLLDNANTSAQRARTIVEDLLSFSRRPAGKLEPVDMHQIIESSLKLAETEFNTDQGYDFRAIRLETSLCTPPPPIVGLADQLQQALLNLLRNAAQAMFRAGVRRPCIHIELTDEDDHALLRLSDNGPGMDEATRNRIFEPFFTTRSGQGGTGLGLALVSFIITQNHGGSINVQSTPGQGTTFILQLPTTRSKEAS